MPLKAGARLRRAVDAGEVMVVRAPGEQFDPRCDGRPFREVDEAAAAATVVAGFGVGTQVGPRYDAEGIGLEARCTKAGGGGVSVGEAMLEIKRTEPVAGSD